MNQNPNQRVVPTLRIGDYDRARRFYVDGLRFAVDWEHRFEPQFPVFAQISRDGMLLFLTQHTGDCEFGALVHLYVDDVDRWYEELRSRRVPIFEEPNEELQGLRTMGLRDPDGNKLQISTRLPSHKREQADEIRDKP